MTPAIDARPIILFVFYGVAICGALLLAIALLVGTCAALGMVRRGDQKKVR